MGAGGTSDGAVEHALRGAQEGRAWWWCWWWWWVTECGDKRQKTLCICICGYLRMYHLPKLLNDCVRVV
eukprot:scaffold177692_cov24-Tisochrysis_lutea.AAC.2